MENNEHLTNVAMSFYVGEPCRVCGVLIKPEDLSELIYAGYSVDNKARAAHGNCWNENKPKSEWAYPTDAPADAGEETR